MTFKLSGNISAGLIGVGNARDHSCLSRLLTDTFISEVYFYCVGQGNALINRLSPIYFETHEDILNHAIKNRVDLIICLDPELLIEGMLSTFTASGIAIFGPERAPSELEGSKKLMKNLLLSANLPTPKATFSNSLAQTLAYIERRPSCVLKSDVFLANAHLRTIVTRSKAHAQESAGLQAQEFERLGLEYSAIVEEKVCGEELSLHLFWDGESFFLLPPVKDYKQAGDGDTGPNTHGAAAIAHGMGYSQAFSEYLELEIIEPLLRALKLAGLTYRGIVYIGLIVKELEISILEINVRPGNPEFIALLKLIKSSLGEIIWNCSQAKLSSSKVVIHEDRITGVVFAMAKEYPEEITIEACSINGLDLINGIQGVEVYGEGIILEGIEYRINGGRVVAVASSGKSLAVLRTSIYAGLKHIEFDGKHYRGDLGFGINDRILNMALPTDKTTR